MDCPVCKAKNTVNIQTENSFICEHYVDIPANCIMCEEELRVVYDFTAVTIDDIDATIPQRKG